MRGHRQVGVWYKKIGPITDWTKASNEPGKVQCECGYMSRNLPDDVARAQWHRQHKAEVAALATAQRRDDAE